MQHTKKCSAILAAGAGAAVCLSGSPALAVSGPAGNNLVSMGGTQTEFGGKISLSVSMSFLCGRGSNNTEMVRATFGMPWHIATYASNAQCTSLFSGGSWAGCTLRVVGVPGGDNRYIKIRFNDGGGYKYGWSQYKDLGGGTWQFGAWSYSNTVDGAILTLADSVKAQKLGLADGREKLVWSNANEEGVARYEVQAKDASGAWNAVSSEAPGAGMYSIAVPKGSNCRIVVEKVDGTAENIAF